VLPVQLTHFLVQLQRLLADSLPAAVTLPVLLDPGLPEFGFRWPLAMQLIREVQADQSPARFG
jgi:hypothetical protein